jgi:exo-beta-1,3-glucanase (GH17 family)
MENLIYEFENINGKINLTIKNNNNEDLSINLHLFRNAIKSLSMSSYLKVIKQEKWIVFQNTKYIIVFSDFKSSYLSNYCEELHFAETLQSFLNFKDLENRLSSIFLALNFKVENYNYVGTSEMCSIVEVVDDKDIDFVDKRRIVRKKTTVEE